MDDLLNTFQTITKNLEEHLPEDKKYIMDIVYEHLRKTLEPNSLRKGVSWKGIYLPPGFEVETVKYAYDSVEFKKNSIFVVTFPKTGTTWTIQIIRQMLYGQDAKMNEISKLLTPHLYYLEMGTALKHDAMLNLPLPKVLYGSHLPEDLVNVERITRRKGKFIIVLRNPKDQAVSLYHFLQHPAMLNKREQIPSDWPGFFDKLVSGKLPIPTKEGEWYPDHILGWYKHKNDDNFLFLYYEDMKQDCRREMKKIAKFLDLNLSEERLKEIGESTSFKSMKKGSEDKNTGGLSKLLGDLNFFRKGQVGNWKEVFTVAQSELMDKLIEEKLGQTDIKFTYEL